MLLGRHWTLVYAAVKNIFLEEEWKFPWFTAEIRFWVKRRRRRRNVFVYPLTRHKSPKRHHKSSCLQRIATHREPRQACLKAWFGHFSSHRRTLNWLEKAASEKFHLLFFPRVILFFWVRRRRSMCIYYLSPLFFFPPFHFLPFLVNVIVGPLVWKWNPWLGFSTY